MVTGFGTSGIIHETSGTEGGYGYSILNDGTYLYTSGQDGPTAESRIEKRSMSDGSYAASTDQVPLAAQDTAYALTSATNAFRLRMTMAITVNQLYAGTLYKLKFAPMVGAACGGGDETFTDVATGSGAIRYYDNSSLANGSAFSTDSDDPVYSAQTNVSQTYVESNNFSVATNVPVGQDGVWDFALTPQYAPVGTTYCFEATASDDTALNTYTTYPRITTMTPTTNESSYRWFQNSNVSGFGTGGVVTGASASTTITGSAKDSTYLYRRFRFERTLAHREAPAIGRIIGVDFRHRRRRDRRDHVQIRVRDRHRLDIYVRRG